MVWSLLSVAWTRAQTQWSSSLDTWKGDKFISLLHKRQIFLESMSLWLYVLHLDYYWMIGTNLQNEIGRWKSCSKGLLLPPERNWHFFDGKNWKADLSVKSLGDGLSEHLRNCEII